MRRAVQSMYARLCANVERARHVWGPLLLCLLYACSSLPAGIDPQALEAEPTPLATSALQEMQRKLHESVAQSPKAAQLWRLLALAHLHRGALSQARSAAGTAYRLEPLIGENLLVLGRVLRAQEQLHSAVEALEQALLFSEKKGAIYRQLALTYLSLGQPEKARSALRAVLDEDAQAETERVRLAALELSLGQRTAAASTLHEGLEQNPHSLPLLRLQVRWLRAEGRREAALQRTEAALSDHPQDEALRLEALELYQERGNVSQVRARLAAWRRPLPWRAVKVQVEQLRAQGRLREAFARLKDEQAQHGDLRPTLALAALQLREGEAASVRELLLPLVAQEENSVGSSSLGFSEAELPLEAHYLLAAAHWDLEAYEEADESLRKAERAMVRATAAQPSSLAIPLLRGALLLSTARRAAAQAALTKVLQQYPQHPDALLFQALLHSLAGDQRSAKASLLRIPPTAQGPAHRYTEALIAYQSGRFEEAAKKSAAPALPIPLWRWTYLRAAALSRQGKLVAAQALLHESTAHSHPLLFRLAGDLAQLHQGAQQALLIYEEGLRNFSGNPLILEGISRAAMALGDWRRAQTALEQLRLHGGLPEALLQERLSWNARMQRHLEDAQTAQRSLIAATDPLRFTPMLPEAASSSIYVLFLPPAPPYRQPSYPREK